MAEKIDRRCFVKRIAGVGALIATSQLPAFADDPKAMPHNPDAMPDNPAVFPERGGYERLLLAYSTVKIGLEQPFSVLHISDTHFTSAYPHEDEKKQQLAEIRTKTFGGRQEEALRDSLSWAKQHVDYVVHTGDIIDWQSEANFDLVKKYFGDKMFGSLGNHEFSQNMWLTEPKEEGTEAFKDQTRQKLQSVYPFDVRFCSQVVHGVNFITMDDVYGYVMPEQVELFKEEVRRGLPIVLCIHVPFHTDETWRVTHRYWNEKGPYRDGAIPEITGDYKVQKEDAVTRDFIAYLKTEPLLKAILAGHEHIMAEDRFSPTAMEYLVGGNFMFHGREVLFV